MKLICYVLRDWMNIKNNACAVFSTTHWTHILQATNPAQDSDRSAFAELYLSYWYPLYLFVRRRGVTAVDAEDLTQDFFAHLVSSQSLTGLQREGGKFRSFLLRCLENFLRHKWRQGQAQKRGAGQQPLSIDVEAGERRFLLEIRDEETPERAFERQWAITLLENVTEQLCAEYAAANKSELYDHLIKYLRPDRSGLPYSATAAECGMTEGALKVAVHRMRHRYGELLRLAVSRTVKSAEEIDEEIQYLIGVVSL